MLTPIARNMHTRLPARYPAGTSGDEIIVITWIPIKSTTLEYAIKVISAESNEEMIPIITPSTRNGHLMNQLVAPI